MFNNFTFVANYEYTGISSENNKSSTSTEPIVNQYLYEIGGGYYKTFNHDLMFEVFGLFGCGYGKIDDKTTDIYRYALQTDFGVSKQDMNFCFTIRTGYLNYSTQLPANYYSNYNLAAKGGSFFIDPALSFKFGGENLKFFIQYGVSKAFKSYPHKMWTYSWFLVGINLSFNNSKSRRKSTN